MFYENKYTKWYYAIIQLAKSENREGYGEVHHIIPRSLGGSDEADNLVFLTYREHYIVHALLVRMNSSPKLVYAFWCMSFKNEKKYFNSRLYEDAKRRYSEIVSGELHWMKTVEARERVSLDWTEERKNDFKEKVSGNKHWTKKTDRSEHAKLMRSKLSHDVLVENGRKSIFVTDNPMKNPDIAALFKKPKEKVECPYCHKIGGKPVMMRYHFEMCKER
jgi:hypothetical protein